MDTIKIDIDQTNNVVSVYNNGAGIPVVWHKKENMYVPTMIFGNLLTSSNYDDAEQKVTGGRNGYGAKLCNIFSTKFTVETASKEQKLCFKQTWKTNMSKASEPKVDSSSNEFTKITFSPDLAKFKMETLDDDIVALFSRRAYDIAASSKGVKVMLNGKRVAVKNFKDYVDLFLKDHLDEQENQIKCVYEQAHERWEVAIAMSEKGFQQMSFVNSIATTKGGRHIDYVTDMVVKSLTETLKKKNKSGVVIKPFQIKNHLWVFVNCLIVNPTFDSQTKENMTLQAKSFGSKCSLSDKFTNQLLKCGLVESIMQWAKFKAQTQLDKKCQAKKQNKLKGIPKLEDANDAGTKFSSDCTLILTEGDSAKTLAVAGLSVVGRDRYGVFPLRGKPLNVREATHKQILENAEINNLIKIIGLQYKKKYETSEDLKSLRYGKLMIMTDQDQDGSHIKGLIINFIHANWPTLLRTTFMEEFITPIVKASKGSNEIAFYSLPEYEEWRKDTPNSHTFKIKYYKGLGTSTSKEAKEYFQDMIRHRVKFAYNGNQDDHLIQMAFSKKCIDQRKEWLTSWMDECKRRRELGLPEVYLYQKDTQAISYSDFINKELVLFSNMDNERSIPSAVDGFKPGQRKVMFACFKRNDKREVKVAQLAGSVAEHSAYHHGEQSLHGTIINLAQNHVGSNNINLLQPIGQFGTRLQGGKDHASPRYIFTMLSPLARYIYHPHDDALLKYNVDDNQRIEPEYYVPIIPMALVNGAEGIGTGWSTRVHNYNPRDLVGNLKRMIRGDDPRPMHPWFKNFKGTIDELDIHRYAVHGEIGLLDNNKVEITELPLRKWTQDYKESVLEPMLSGSEKNPETAITEYKEYNTDVTVRFTVSLTPAKFEKARDEGLHKFFKLQSMLSLSSMVLFDKNNILRRYDTPEEILRDFFDLRLKFYVKRKAYLVGMLEAEASQLSNRARFILEKCDGRLTIENKKKKEMIAELVRKGYDSDPIKAWKKASEAASDGDSDNEFDEDEPEVDDAGQDYDYLLGMPMWNLTKEKKDKLVQERDEKVRELEELKSKTPEDLWEHDLDEFSAKLDEVEQKEFEEQENIRKGKPTQGKGLKGKAKKLKDEVMPSPLAERVMPRIDNELRKKAAAATKASKGAKVKKEIKEEAEDDEFDDMLGKVGKKDGLANRLGSSPQAISDSAKKQLKQTKLNFKKASPKKKFQYNSDESDQSDDDLGEGEEAVYIPREAPRRGAAAKVKYNFSDNEQESEEEFHDNEGVAEPELQPQQMTFNEDSASDLEEVTPPPKKQKKKPVVEVDSGSDSEFDMKPMKVSAEKKTKKAEKKASPPSKASAPAPAPSASDLFDSMMGGSPPSGSSSPAKSSKSKAITDDINSDIISDSESEEELPKPKKKLGPKASATALPGKAKKAAAPKPKKEKEEKPKATKAKKVVKRKNDDSDSDDMFESKAKKNKKSDDTFELSSPEVVAPRATSGRARAQAKKYAFSDSEDDMSDY